MNQIKATPMIRQYLSIKEQYPDAILFYRMGDFYEMFFEDAEIASRALEITLTSRNRNDEIPVPMCGVPFRAARTYIARLIEQGHKVAVCDQTEDPASAKGLVRREVVRVISPGMILENELLDEKSNNFILAAALLRDVIGIAYLDLSTGIFRMTEARDLRRIVDEVLRVSPSEVLFPETAKTDPFFSPLRDALGEKATAFLEVREFELQKGRERLLEHFGTLTLEGFGCEDLTAATAAAGALIHYIRENQKQKIPHVSRIETYSLDHHLIVDEASCRNLELIGNLRTGTRKGTLLGILDRTLTPMGARLLRSWLQYPLLDPDAIGRRLDAVSEAKSEVDVRKRIREGLKSVYDLERLSSRITMGQGNARDLTALRKSIQALPALWESVARLRSELFAPPVDPSPLFALADLIEKAVREDAPPTIGEGGMIRDGFNSELDALIGVSRDGKGWISRLEANEKSATGINSLKVRYNRVFGYYIEISKAQAGNVPERYIRKQTLVNAERFVTGDLKAFEEKVLGAEERRMALELEIFQEIRGKVVRAGGPLQSVSGFIAVLDCLVDLAHIAEENRYVRPDINTEGRIDIEEGRHPVVEKTIAGERYVPNTIRIDNRENQVLVITGPNMAGKSTVLRQVALQVLMAQIGSFVPAERASFSITDRIFTRVGALDNLSQGQSTFMVEMQETANILNNATGRSLVILDEIGRGTSTFDGLSIAWSVAEFLHDFKGRGVKTLFATHYHELTDLALSRPRVKNFNIAVKEWKDEIIFLRKLVEGSTNKSYGIHVARLAGIPESVVHRARKILSTIESDKKGLKVLNLLARGRKGAVESQEQLSLFPGADDRAFRTFLEKLKALDISTITPLEAINLLNGLKEEAERFSRTG